MQEAREATEQMCLSEDCEEISSSTQSLADEVQGLEKSIPDAPKTQTPVHLRDYQVMADSPHVLKRGEKDVGIMKDGSTPAKQ